MNILLWILQGLLAAMFLMAGFLKLTQPKEDLKEKMGEWVDAVSDSNFKLIGLLEFLGAVGVVLPMAINVLPLLTPIAAMGLALTMVVAMLMHIKRKEMNKVAPNVALFILSLLVVIGRLLLVPVTML